MQGCLHVGLARPQTLRPYCRQGGPEPISWSLRPLFIAENPGFCVPEGLGMRCNPSKKGFQKASRDCFREGSQKGFWKVSRSRF